MAEIKKEKMAMYEFPVHDSTDSPYFSSIVRQCKWLSLSGNIVKIQKFCCHGNVTSHLSSLCALFSSRIEQIAINARYYKHAQTESVVILFVIS